MNELQKIQQTAVSLFAKGRGHQPRQEFKEQNVSPIDPVPQEKILEVAQETKADVIFMGSHERIGLGSLLLGSVARIHRKTLGLDNRHRPAMTVAQHVVGASTVRTAHLIAHRVLVLGIPALRGELSVNQDARESFVF